MKLVALECNDEALFPAIRFHEGLNVVFARVRDPLQRDRDSHNLGKTFLIEVIDFTLLKSIDKTHTFKRFQTLFGDLVFYLQLVTPHGEWVTVRRSVEGKKPCSIFVSANPTPLAALPDPEHWTHSSLSVPKAEECLDALLGLAVAEPYDYRKGLGYVMRRQSDWGEVFHLDRFRRGRDKDWKPYVASLLGLDSTLVIEKYEIEERIAGLETNLRGLEQEAGSRSSEYDRIKGLIELKGAEVARHRAELNQFSFRELEAEVSSRGVHVIEEEIVTLNERRYTIDYELKEIERSLETSLPFDLARIRQVFEEAQIAFSDTLTKGYEDLLDFNRRVSTGRVQRLGQLQEQLLTEREQIEVRLARLDSERRESLRVLQERETFKKYRYLQDAVRAQEAEIAELERRLEKLDLAASMQREIQEARATATQLADRIREMVRRGNPRLTSIRQLFAEYVRKVLSVPALLSVTVNESGNLMFDVQTLDRSIAERETNEASGTSYRKILCTCFDLALLSAYAKERFYRFLYHDGVLEGLDNRKKVNLTDLIRGACAEYGLQYVLTVIDSDLPRDERDEKLLFTSTEIVRELHDQGDSGRLFRMPAF